MILGIGTDLCLVDVWAADLAHPSPAAARGIFTPTEWAIAHAGPVPPAERLAARFAAKEAFVKALDGADWGLPPRERQIDLREIEVVHDGFGRPRIHLHGRMAALAQQAGVARIHLSLSHEATVATAFVVLEGTEEGGIGRG